MNADPRPLGHLGIGLLGAGLVLRVLVPDEPSATPVITAIPQIALIAGAAVVLLERLLRGGQALPVRSWLPVVAISFGLFPATAVGLLRGADLLAAIATGLALRDLVVHDGIGRHLLRCLLGLATLLAVLGLAQFLYQRDELREIVAHQNVGAFATDTEQAFLASDRAAGTLTNANAYAGWLLLLLPLAAAGCASASARRWAAPVTALAGCAFAAAASAGAALSGLLASGLLLRRGQPRPSWAVATFVISLGGVALLVLSLATGFDPPLVHGKVRTFEHRIDYHHLGGRALLDEGLLGAGLEATRELRLSHARPDQAHSAYLHDSWLQLLVELGPFGLGLLIFALVVFLRRRAHPSESPPTPVANTLLLGAVMGCALAPWLNRVGTILPLSWGQPAAADALVNASVFGVVLLASRRASLPISRTAWTVSIGAFLLHGFLDYAPYVPQVAVVAAAVMALAPGRGPDDEFARPRRAARPAMAAAALFFLVLPLGIGHMALARDEAARAVDAVSRGDHAETSIQTLQRFFAMTPVPADPLVLQALSAAASARAPQLVEDALDALPSTVRSRPSFRRAEAMHLWRRALVDPGFHDLASQRLAALHREGDLVEPRILLVRALLARQQGNGAAAKALALKGLRTVNAFGLGNDPIARELRAVVK